MIPALKVWFIIRPVEFYLLVAWKMQLNHLDVSSSLYLSFSCFETNSWRVLGDLMEYVFWIVSFDLWFYYYYFFLFSTGVNYPLRVLGVQVHFYWSGRGGVGVGERRKKNKKEEKGKVVGAISDDGSSGSSWVSCCNVAMKYSEVCGVICMADGPFAYSDGVFTSRCRRKESIGPMTANMRCIIISCDSLTIDTTCQFSMFLLLVD